MNFKNVFLALNIAYLYKFAPIGGPVIEREFQV